MKQGDDRAAGVRRHGDGQSALAWFREAKYGMFIHWGLYSLLARGEWVKHMDGIADAEYEALATRFQPRPGCAREWAALARRAGMKYVVFTTKHHDGFCNFASSLTPFNSVATGGRDYVREAVEAFRAEGLKVGLYYSLGDWHEPCYLATARGDRDQAGALRRFLHGHVRELCSAYGPIDLLWYDGAWYDGEYLTAATVDAAGMNALARQLQPGILINERAGTREDFVTCENECKPAPFGEDWEMCTCLNDLWGYAAHDYNYKTVNQLLFLLVNCAVQGGNLLLNVGPTADGTVPPEQATRLEAVGRWLAANGESIYGVERLRQAFFGGGRLTRSGRRLYVHTFYWPGTTMRLPGLTEATLLGLPGERPVAASLLASGEAVQARWDGTTLVLDGLPETPPDRADTVIAIDLR